MRATEHPQKRRSSPRRGTPREPATCKHNYPILILPADEGRRGFCLGCKSVGPVREGSRAARMALASTCT
jgi:hypothetical protein